MIARWPGHIRAGSTMTHVAAHWDLWATFASSPVAPPRTATGSRSRRRSSGDPASGSTSRSTGSSTPRVHLRPCGWGAGKASAPRSRNSRTRRSVVRSRRRRTLRRRPAAAHPDVVRRIRCSCTFVVRTPAVLEKWNFQ